MFLSFCHPFESNYILKAAIFDFYYIMNQINFSIEGNLGVGKTTLAQQLEKELGESQKPFQKNNIERR